MRSCVEGEFCANAAEVENRATEMTVATMPVFFMGFLKWIMLSKSFGREM